MLIIYIIYLFLQKPEIQTVGNGKKTFFSYFISEVPRFSDMAFSKNAQYFVGELLS